MTTTTTTTENRPADRRITYCGISAPAQLWRDLGYTVYSNTDELGGGFGDRPKDAELYEAMRVTGSDTELALGWLYEQRKEMNQRKTHDTAIARLAEALTELARTLPGASHTLENAAARMMEVFHAFDDRDRRRALKNLR